MRGGIITVVEMQNEISKNKNNHKKTAELTDLSLFRFKCLIQSIIVYSYCLNDLTCVSHDLIGTHSRYCLSFKSTVLFWVKYFIISEYNKCHITVT